MQRTTLPEPVTKTFGTIRISAIRTVGGGYTIEVTAPTSSHRYTELAYSTFDRDAYRAHYRRIAEAGLAGMHPEQIAELIHGPARQAIADAEQVITNAFADLASAGRRPQISPTRAGAQHAPLSDPQKRLLKEAARDGSTIIARSNGVSNTMLISLGRKGYGHLVYRTTVRDGRMVDHLILNDRAVREGAKLAGVA